MGFAIIFAALILADAWLFSQGWNSWLFRAKTPEEKALRRAILEKRGVKFDSDGKPL